MCRLQRQLDAAMALGGIALRPELHLPGLAVIEVVARLASGPPRSISSRRWRLPSSKMILPTSTGRSCPAGRGPDVVAHTRPVRGEFAATDPSSAGLAPSPNAPYVTCAPAAPLCGLERPPPDPAATKQHAVPRLQLGGIDLLQRSPRGRRRRAVGRIVAAIRIDIIGLAARAGSPAVTSPIVPKHTTHKSHRISIPFIILLPRHRPYCIALPCVRQARRLFVGAGFKPAPTNRPAAHPMQGRRVRRPYR